jgi:excisionase family DNA binding protein
MDDHTERETHMERLALTLSEVAELLAISPQHARDLAHEGAIPSVKLGRSIRIPLAALNEVLSPAESAKPRLSRASKEASHKGSTNGECSRD